MKGILNDDKWIMYRGICKLYVCGEVPTVLILALCVGCFTRLVEKMILTVVDVANYRAPFHDLSLKTQSPYVKALYK